MMKFEKSYLRVKVTRINCLTFYHSVLNDESNIHGPKSIHSIYSLEFEHDRDF